MKISISYCFTLLLVVVLLAVFVAANAKSGRLPATPGMAMLGIDSLPAPEITAKRRKRKVSNLQASTGALEYMTDLRNSLSDSDGRPMFEHEDDPTSVWCIRDRDIVHNAYRRKPNRPSKCSLQNTFIFNLKSLVENEEKTSLPLQKAILRAYLKTNQKLLNRSGGSVPVDIEIQAGGLGATAEAKTVKVVVTSSTNWLEIDVTSGMQEIWPPALSSLNHDVEFTLILSVNCKDIKKVPAIFIDPTEIALSKAKRRQRYTPFQPLLLMFFTDEHIKALVRNESLSAESSQVEELDQMDGMFHEHTGAERRKRDLNSPCKLQDFSVIFHELHLYYVYIPFMYNARECAGSCSHYVLTGQDKLGTNHAKIMASAYAVSKYDPTVNFHHEPREPCCVPTRYSSMTLVVDVGEGLQYVVYPAMRVEECGCR